MDEIPTVTENCAGQPTKPSGMKLYKFRSLERFEYVADIMMNQRFYMAPFPKLNDPMEGLFHLLGFSNEFQRGMEVAKKDLRICSFNRCFTSPVCWAHYADNFRGICIEIESTQRAYFDVDYQSSRILVDESNAGAYVCLPQLFFTRKLEAWRYERETRYIDRDEYLYADPWWTMKRVLLGVRTSDAMRKVIRQITPASVSVWTTRINNQDCIEIDTEVTQ